MTGKTPEKQTKRKTQHAQAKAAPTDISPPDDNELVQEHGTHPHDAPCDAKTWSNADEEELRKHFEKHYNWDALVREHGVEGAEMILDCLDFDF